MAFEKTKLLPASESRNGVTGREYPKKPTWSALKQSTVTIIKERFFIRSKIKSRIAPATFSAAYRDLAGAIGSFSNVAEIFKPLFNNFFLCLIKLTPVVLDDLFK